MVNILLILGGEKVFRFEDGHQDIFTGCLTADAGDPFLVRTNFERNLDTLHVVVDINCLSHHWTLLSSHVLPGRESDSNWDRFQPVGRPELQVAPPAKSWPGTGSRDWDGQPGGVVVTVQTDNICVTLCSVHCHNFHNITTPTTPSPNLPGLLTRLSYHISHCLSDNTTTGPGTTTMFYVLATL